MKNGHGQLEHCRLGTSQCETCCRIQWGGYVGGERHSNVPRRRRLLAAVSAGEIRDVERALEDGAHRAALGRRLCPERGGSDRPCRGKSWTSGGGGARESDEDDRRDAKRRRSPSSVRID